MDIAALEPKTVILLWSAQTMTIGLVFTVLWLHKTRQCFHLFFALGFCLSSLGAANSYFFSSSTPFNAIVLLLAHSFWLMGILSAQGRKIEPWVAAPLLIYILCMLIPGLRADDIWMDIGLHLASLAGFSLLAVALMTTSRHKSLTRKLLAFSLAGFGLVMSILGIAAACGLEQTAPTAAKMVALAQSATTVFGFTFLLMVAAKMVIEDNERRLMHLALTDHLTGVYNRRALGMIFDQAQSHIATEARFLSIAMFDIDHFKKINDQYGHAFGDYVLKAFVQMVSERLGPHDDLIRMGGEEFAVISRISSFGDASRLAERLRIDFGNLPLRVGNKSVRATVSAGIAAQPLASADLYGLLSKADRGLYSAKKAGRDRCVIYDEGTSVTIPSTERDPTEMIESYTDKQVAILQRISAIAEAHQNSP